MEDNKKHLAEFGRARCWAKGLPNNLNMSKTECTEPCGAFEETERGVPTQPVETTMGLVRPVSRRVFAVVQGVIFIGLVYQRDRNKPPVLFCLRNAAVERM